MNFRILFGHRKTKFLTIIGVVLLALIFLLNTIRQPVKLSPGFHQKDNEFGWALASDGNSLVIGADTDDSMGDKAGAVYIFTRANGRWIEKQKLIASDSKLYKYFGRSVAISGNTIVVGAFGDDNNGNASGSAYVFDFVDNQWVEQQKLVASDSSGGSQFGASVAIDGDTIIVGAYGHNAAYIFSRKNDEWIQQAKLTVAEAPNNNSNSYFGGSVAIKKNIVAVGATGIASVFVFARHNDTWVEQQRLSAQNEAGCGWSVAMDERTIVVGSPGGGTYIGNNYLFDSGAAYIFTWDGEKWVQQAKLTAKDASEDAWLGRSVAIYKDTVIVGAPKEASGSFGAVYVFTRDGNTWQEKLKLTEGSNQGIKQAVYRGGWYLQRVINGLEIFSFDSWTMSIQGGYRYPTLSIMGPAITLADNLIAVGDYESYTGDDPAVFVYELDELLNIK